MKKKIIVVAGPTASGKTALAIEIAKAVDGEIISADSMQVYKNMPIATAAPTADEKAIIAHHLVEFLNPEESFSVAQWCDLARAKIDEIISGGRVPIIAGGTGLFIDSLVDNIIFEDIAVDEELRAELMQKDTEELYSELMAADPQAAGNIHKNNKKRVVRALELYYSGSSKTLQDINSKKTETPFDTLYFFINYRDRQVLYEKINKRVDRMMSLGLLDEAEANIKKASGTSAQAIGHKELAPFFFGDTPLEMCIDNLKKETRHYAKRQITWFKRRKTAVLLEPDVLGDGLNEYALSICEDFINGSFKKAKSE